MQNPIIFSRRRFLADFRPSILKAAPANAQLNIAFIGYGKRAFGVIEKRYAEEEFPNDAEANALTTRKPREGWEYA